ncbi:MAG: type II toxin-antitoxin system PemK/MazF family toxin [Actinomycetota bacterium]|nr:type II toxin-antitoxin system PemK/MazF family toxin [Actinomycetota bacterium]
MAGIWNTLGRQLGRLAVQQGPRLLRQLQSSSSSGGGRPVTARARPSSDRARHLEYAATLDGKADPGEVVWTWVTFEEDPGQGKDRPVLVVGREGSNTLLGLMLSSQGRRDGERDWLSLGAGAWDQEHRPSWVRLDRVLDVPEEGIRREGAIMERALFDRVAERLRAEHGWR